MDADRASAMQMVANSSNGDYGIPVRIETPEKITRYFPLRLKAGKGPDMSFGHTIDRRVGQMAG